MYKILLFYSIDFLTFHSILYWKRKDTLKDIWPSFYIELLKHQNLLTISVKNMVF